MRIVALLRHGELTVSELMAILGQSQPRVSRHLKLLVEAGLAERLPEGAWVFFRLSGGAAARSLAELAATPEVVNDPELARDLTRLDEVKRARADAAEAYFETVARDWERIRALHFPEDAVEAALREAAGAGPFTLHLDIGTGTGRMLEVFADQARDGLGVDLNHEMLTVARANIARAGLSDRWVRQADAGALPVESGTADLITVHQVLHYLDHPGRVIAECGRALAPGGRIVIADFARHALEFLRENHHHRRLGFEPAEIEAWLREAGLEPEAPQALASKGDGERLTVLIMAAGKPAETPAHAGVDALEGAVS
ncbi:MAG: metalloregulator ArsR/SmtB family transcription factor [Pseudomonadota bacterium]